MEKLSNIGLLTLDSHIYNYGGILQEYALQSVLRSLGIECEIIDYDVSSEMNTFSMKRSIYNFRLQKVMDKVCNGMKHKKENDVHVEVDARKKSFDRFRSEYMNLSRPYRFPELEHSQLPYDALICGSDQIWNPDFNIPSFFLSFAGSNIKKIIYAASIGKDSLSKRQLKIYKKYMEILDAISVREVSAQKLFASYYKQKIKLVLDPTLLIEKEKWKEIASNRKVETSNYVFCYFLDNTLEKQTAAKKYAEERGLDIVTIPYLHDKSTAMEESFGDVRAFDAGPLEFLSYILNADTVITDSFHATVFSILYNKNYWVFGRKNGNYNMNTRLETLLGYVEGKSRQISPNELSLKKQEKSEINIDKIEKMRSSSIEFLVDALNLNKFK